MHATLHVSLIKCPQQPKHVISAGHSQSHYMMGTPVAAYMHSPMGPVPVFMQAPVPVNGGWAPYSPTAGYPPPVMYQVIVQHAVMNTLDISSSRDDSGMLSVSERAGAVHKEGCGGVPSWGLLSEKQLTPLADGLPCDRARGTPRCRSRRRGMRRHRSRTRAARLRRLHDPHQRRCQQSLRWSNQQWHWCAPTTANLNDVVLFGECEMSMTGLIFVDGHYALTYRLQQRPSFLHEQGSGAAAASAAPVAGLPAAPKVDRLSRRPWSWPATARLSSW
jgi:hypothetical protein